MGEVIILGIFFVFGYVAGFIIGTQTTRFNDQYIKDFEGIRLKQLEREQQQQAKSAQDSQ